MNKKKSMLMSIRSGLKKKTAHIVMSLCKFVIPTSGIPCTVQITTFGKEAEKNSKESNQIEKIPQYFSYRKVLEYLEFVSLEEW